MINEIGLKIELVFYHRHFLCSQSAVDHKGNRFNHFSTAIYLKCLKCVPVEKIWLLLHCIDRQGLLFRDSFCRILLFVDRFRSGTNAILWLSAVLVLGSKPQNMDVNAGHPYSKNYLCSYCFFRATSCHTILRNVIAYNE